MAEGTHLTTSRVNRLLRPLRNKCNALAALQKTPAASRVISSKQPCTWDPASRPPLAILSFPSRNKQLMFETRSPDEFELLRRIHAVCDAFKNIAHGAFGQPCTLRIPSLAAMCTLVIGENMPAEDSLSGPGEDLSDDMLDVDSIYETVPLHHRRFLIVSHALSMILSICIHHHTLLNILLDHCLSFGLVHESTHILNIILAHAFHPLHSSYPPPALHPGHINYLVDLHTKWTTGKKPSGTTTNTLFTTSAFCRVLLGTLSRSPSYSHTIWTSRALNGLLHTVENCDTDSYIVIIHTLSQSFSDRAQAITGQVQLDSGVEGTSPDAIRSDTPFAMLRGKLSELMSKLFDLLFARNDSHRSSLASPRIHAAIDILRSCHAARLHRFRMSAAGSSADLPDILIVFATHIVVAFRNSVDDIDNLLVMLDDSTPVPTTFSKLMVYFSRFQGSQAFGDLVEIFLSETRLYSSALLSENLFKLDASLWACALHHFETSIAIFQKGSTVLVAGYRQQLMEAVDIAERRCFGGDLLGDPIVLSTRPTPAGRTHRPRASGHWEWEDMVGSWIRKTPIHKKRKIGDDPTLQHSYSQRPGTNASLTPKSTPRHQCSSTFSPSSSTSQSPDPESHTEEESEYQESDKENYSSNPSRGISGSRRIKRRSSNFFSLLADAQINRVILHPKPRSPSVIPERYVLPLSSQESRDVLRKQEKRSCSRTVSSFPKPSGPIFPSDDSLDLFAYASSSPPRF